jgi:hypothetical protein
MLRFAVNRNGQLPGEVSLAGAYVVGSDGVPLRADLELREGQLTCAKRAEGAAGIALAYPVLGCGPLLLETSRLIDREKPYDLTLELVRGRLMRISQKREEWGLYDYEGIEPISAEIDKARDLFVEALKSDSLADQNRLAEQALQVAVLAGELLSRFHADVFMTRRRQAHAFGKRNIGCTVDLSQTSDAYRQRIREGFDYAHLPTVWRLLEPKHQESDWQVLDGWVEWLARHRMSIMMGPLVSFDPEMMPPWLAAQAGDFEKLRNVVFEHVRRVVERYGNYVYQWNVISGVHADNAFGLTFEQLMELTRVTSSLVKQLAPRAQTIVDIAWPWGEYYARNQRTIPPMLYADMVVQSGIGCDGIGVQFLFGAPTEGMFVRDMLQISEKLDRLGNFGRPVHVTAVQAPSEPTGGGPLAGGGTWWKPWNEGIQARWVKEFSNIAMSKPYVDTITWRQLADSPNVAVPSAGLLGADLKPKLAFKVVREFRQSILNSKRRPPAQTSG